MILQRANKYRAEPTPYQAQAMGQWVGACRFIYNIGLEQRIDARRRGVRLDYNMQAKELTTCRTMADWLTFAPVHALQYALQSLEDAFARFWYRGTPLPLIEPCGERCQAYELPSSCPRYDKLCPHTLCVFGRVFAPAWAEGPRTVALMVPARRSKSQGPAPRGESPSPAEERCIG